jgi:hypothetical protein
MKTWMDILDPLNKTPIPEIVAYIEDAAKEQLSTLADTEWWRTVELADHIWPPEPNNEVAFLVRSRLYKFLGHIDRRTMRPTILPQWRRRGGLTRSAFGKYVRPWHWFNLLATAHENVNTQSACSMPKEAGAKGEEVQRRLE